MAIKYIDQIDIEKKRLLIRVDYNVPMNDNLEITDATRIEATLPTIEYCRKQNAKIILVSHLGRPKGKVDPKMSLQPIAKKLSEISGSKIMFVDTSPGHEAKNKTDTLKEGEIALLENIRFYPGEEKNDDKLGKALADMADVYINDAFATAHRGHASNKAITKYIPVCAAGFLLKDEIEYFKQITSNPARPLIALIGGAKISSKLNVLKNLSKQVDYLVIGGGMAYTFLKAKGYNIGQSLLEKDLLETAKEIIAAGGDKIVLPVDTVIADKFDNNAKKETVPVDKIPDNMMGLDIGADTIKKFINLVQQAKTIVWNGPMGAFEMPSFANGTNSIAQAIADSDCVSVIGGGDSVTAVNSAGLADKMSYLSTGGGAFLELLEGKTLPALAALES